MISFGEVAGKTPGRNNLSIIFLKLLFLSAVGQSLSRLLSGLPQQTTNRNQLTITYQQQRGFVSEIKAKHYKVHCFFNLLIIVDATDSKRLKIKAQRNPSILIPETNLSVSRIIITFITKRKRPKVIIVSGRVKIIISGLARTLRIASIIAKMIAVVNECISICGSKSFDNPYTTTAVIRILIIHLIIISY